MKPGRKGLTESQRLSHDLPLCTECADLIVEVDGCYQLLHASLREFLLSNHLTLQTYGELQLEAHAILSETCLTYPSFNEFCHASAPTPTELTKLLLQYPLLEYAATYSGNHFRSADGKRTSQLNDLAGKLLQTEAALGLSIKFLEYSEFCRGVFRHAGKPTPLHLLAIFNL